MVRRHGQKDCRTIKLYTAFSQAVKNVMPHSLVGEPTETLSTRRREIVNGILPKDERCFLVPMQVFPLLLGKGEC
jgi:hypothetical protein